MITSVTECNHHLAIIDEELVRLITARYRIVELRKLLYTHTAIGGTMRITEVKFQDSNHRYGDREAIATMEDGSEQFVFPWFSDELFFNKSDFIGKTVEQARDLKQARDVAYLQS